MKGYTKTAVRNIAATCLIGLSLCCCGHGATGKTVTNGTDTVFTLPEIPKELTEPGKRADYLAMHYWDSLNPALLRSAEDSITVEQAFVDLLSILPLAGTSVPDKAVTILLEKLQPERDAYGYFMELAYKYLYDADSPMENEEMLVPYLEYATDTLREDDYIRMRAGYMQDLVMRNRAGTKAVDFHYIDRDGKRGTLWSTKAERMLVVFYDPECTHCTETMAQLTQCPAIANGRLSILAVYTEGKKNIWESTKNSLPEDWTVVMDIDGINENQIYDLKAMPMIYLLDSDKNVVMKNMDIGELNE